MQELMFHDTIIGSHIICTVLHLHVLFWAHVPCYILIYPLYLLLLIRGLTIVIIIIIIIGQCSSRWWRWLWQMGVQAAFQGPAQRSHDLQGLVDLSALLLHLVFSSTSSPVGPVALAFGWLQLQLIATSLGSRLAPWMWTVCILGLAVIDPLVHHLRVIECRILHSPMPPGPAAQLDMIRMCIYIYMYINK